MIFGTDTSKYQPPGSYDPGAFEIVNAEDYTMPIKAARNADDRRPQSLYVWQYSYDTPATLVDRLLRGLDKAGHPMTLLDGWWDFEDTGVNQGTLEGALDLARDRGLTTGYYTNDWRVSHNDHLREFAYWPCAYPGSNNGSFPGFGAFRTSRPAHLWQFTSTSGTLDQNVVVDEEWYFRVTSGVPVPVPPAGPMTGAWNMACVGHHWPDSAAPGANDDWYAIDGGVILHIFGGDRSFLGIPAEAVDWVNKGIPVTPLSDGDLATAKKRSGWE